jgi:hypothetical protein
MQASLIGPSGQTILGPAGLTIGRMQSNQLVVYDRKVSARHAVISSLKQGYYSITDIGSTYGTFVNGLTLTHNVPHRLYAGDTIRIGDTNLTFQISDEFHTIPDKITPSTRGHRRSLVALLLASLMLIGVIAFGIFEYLNYLNRSTPDKTLGTFCTTLQSKDYQSVYGQLSNKLQGLGSENMIADDLSNVKRCTFKISKESENFAAAKISFIGQSGQIGQWYNDACKRQQRYMEN